MVQRSQRVKQDNYNIISNDEYCHIQGNSRETIDKGVRIRVNVKVSQVIIIMLR